MYIVVYIVVYIVAKANNSQNKLTGPVSIDIDQKDIK